MSSEAPKTAACRKDPNSSALKPRDTKPNLDRLAGRVLEEGVVPFVGAGFSYGAKLPRGGVSIPERMPDLLWNALCEATGNYLRDKPKEGCPDCSRGDKPVVYCKEAAEGQMPAAESCALQALRVEAKGSLARLAELGGRVWGARQVCEILEIDQYAELQPLPCHRYLAYLAREGLIHEVFTTNYDCCIVKAFRESLVADEPTGDAVVVVRSLEEYRRKAGRHNQPGHLLIYKLNGCAWAYKQAKQQAIDLPSPDNDRAWDQAAERIILTERQLQNFRQEDWARDLFQDRARSRNLLFSGFGSEEPQIRHPALALMEEFSRECSLLPAEDVVKLPNAPFIQVYKDLSFYQFQILAAFMDAHAGTQRSEAQPQRPIEPLLRNAFLGEDAHVLNPEAKEHKLDASVFFRHLYERVFCKLVKKQLKVGALPNWLQEQTPEYRVWLSHLEHVLFPDDAGEPLVDLLRPSTDGAPFPLHLWRLLYVMRYPGRDIPRDYYLPLRKDSLFILVTLLLISFARSEGDTNPQVHPEPPLGLALEIPPTQPDEVPIKVHLVREHATQGIRNCVGQERHDRLLRIISVPSSREAFPSERWISRTPAIDPKDHDTLTCGLRVTISASDLISEAVRPEPERLRAALLNCFAASRPRPAARLIRLNQLGARES
jgi:hypothetical protein